MYVAAFLFEVLGGDGPTLTLIWGIFMGIGILGLLVAGIRWYLVFAVLLVWLFFSGMWWTTFHEPDIYPQIQKEDPNFLPVVYLGMAVSFVMLMGGMIFQFRRRRK